jgi:thimet oligopeptidase
MALVDFSNLTVSMLEKMCKEYMDNQKTLNDQLASLSPELLSYKTLIQPDLDYSNKNAKLSAYLDMSQFHPEKDIRDKCNDLSTEVQQFDTEQGMRKDLYLQFMNYMNSNYNVEKDLLTNEQKKYLEKNLINYKMLGLHLPNDEYERIKEIKKQITKMANDFDMNLANCSTSFVFSKDELEGLPDKWLSDRLQENGNYKVTLKYPDYIPMMEYCKNRDIRKNMSVAFTSRCQDTNLQLAEEIFKLRDEMAKYFNGSSFADYKMQIKMAKNAKTVNNFLQSLHEKSDILLEQDKKSLLELAKDDGIYELESYDINFYSRIYEEKMTSLDKEELKKYFPLETVKKGMFEIYQQLFGFKFTDITEENKHTFWHEDVRLYNVHNSSDNSFVGQFYMDLYPRDGKYGHAAIFTLVPKSSDNHCVCAMACNFSKTENLTFDFVETFFHEFGHIMHNMSSEATIASLSGTRCERDAVELPSQQLEEWCYRSIPLKMMSVGITDDVIEKLSQQKKLLQGLFLKRQLSFGMFDMAVHSGNFTNTVQLYNDIYYKLLGMKLPEGTCFPGTFSHIIGGYEAGYYGYLWSKVYAVDIFESVFKGHELDPEVGMRFRKQILSYGGMRDTYDSLVEFLGRPPSDNAFLGSLFDVGTI